MRNRPLIDAPFTRVRPHVLHSELPRERVDQEKPRREISRRILATLAGATTAAALIAAPSAAFAKASVDGLEGFVTVVPTAFVDDNPAGVELMFAECDMQRVEKPDGSAVENYQCQLTEPFFEFPGTPPERALVDKAGQCIWYSDYLLDKTGEFLYAETSRLTVTPSGKVSVTAVYPPNPLSEADCEAAGNPVP